MLPPFFLRADQVRPAAKSRPELQKTINDNKTTEILRSRGRSDGASPQIYHPPTPFQSLGGHLPSIPHHLLVPHNVRPVRARGDLPAGHQQAQVAVDERNGHEHEQRQEGAGEVPDSDGETAGGETEAARARREGPVPAEAGEGHLVPVQVRQGGQERGHNPFLAALRLPAVHVYRRRCHVLRQVRAYDSSAEDDELLHFAVLRQGEKE